MKKIHSNGKEKSVKKRFFIFLFVLCFLTVAAFGYEVTERFRLGAVVEGLTYIPSGPLAGKVAFIDGYSVYISDLVLGGYEKLFPLVGIPFAAAPRGIAYLTQGDYAGNFLLSDVANPTTVYLVSTAGSFVGAVHAQDFQWEGGAEGLTQITSGPDQGKIAMLSYSYADYSWHIYIYRLQQTGAQINAYLEKDLPNISPDLPFEPSDRPYRPLGIAFLPADFPDPVYAGMFAVAEDGTQSLSVINDQGTRVATFPGINYSEGLAYIPTGVHGGKLYMADLRLLHVQIRNLGGSQTISVAIPPVGLGLVETTSLKWLNDRQQMIVFGWDGVDWSIPFTFISRLSADAWHLDDASFYTHSRNVRSITDLTPGGTYQLFAIVNPRTEPARFEVHHLDANFQLIGSTAFPNAYTGQSFGSLVYVPGETTADDRYLTFFQRTVYSFDANFSYPAATIDLSGQFTSNINHFCYDPAVRRYYIRDGSFLRVFDANGNSMEPFDLREVSTGPFGAIEKITSGPLRGNVVVLNKGDNELIILNFEYQIAGYLLSRLIEEVQAAGLENGLTNSLVKKLENLKNLTPAVNQIESFRNEVRAQSGKGIPVATAERWLALAADIIRGLQQFL